MISRFQAPRACFALLRPPSLATRLEWLVSCALLLFATHASAGQVSLAWDAVSAPNLGGYRLYYGQASHTYAVQIDVGLQTTATVTGLTDGQTYYFAVTAYDSTNRESPFSNEVSSTITTTATAPVAAFSASPSSGPAPLAVACTDASTGTITAWAWDFGNGTSSTLQFPTHTYSTPGTYTVQLTVTGPGGSNTAIKTGYITVAAPPVANFSASPTSGPAPLPVQFTDASTGSITAWAWSFGDGTSSTARSPQHTYPTAGTYTVSLTVSGPGGSNIATKAALITVTIPAPPVANFSAAPTSGPTPLPVQFTDASTGSITAWAWSFGDGISSTARSPQHTYPTAGTYSVSLTVSGPGGSNTATKVKYITVHTHPTGLVAAYSFDEGSGTAVTDVSGYGNHGTSTGATWITQGKFGKALAFNGATSWVTVPDAPSLDLAAALTLEAWVYPTVKPRGWMTVIDKEEQPDGGVYYLFANSATNKPTTGVIIGGQEHNLYGRTRLAANTWTHLAATYDGTMQRLYINGVQVGRRVQTGLIQGTSGVLRIGGNSVWGEYFRGRVDEVRIYNRALSASEIQADMGTPINLLNSLPPLP